MFCEGTNSQPSTIVLTSRYLGKDIVIFDYIHIAQHINKVHGRRPRNDCVITTGWWVLALGSKAETMWDGPCSPLNTCTSSGGRAGSSPRSPTDLLWVEGQALVCNSVRLRVGSTVTAVCVQFIY